MKINDTKAKTHIAFSSSTPVLMSPFLLMMLSLVSLSSTTTQAIQFWRVRKNIERCSHSHIKSLFREALNVKMRMGWKLFWAVFQFHMRWAEELEAALPVRRACRVPFSHKQSRIFETIVIVHVLDTYSCFLLFIVNSLNCQHLKYLKYDGANICINSPLICLERFERT